MKEQWIEIDKLVEQQRKFFDRGETREYQMRKKQLHILKEAIRRYEAVLLEALQADLGKSPFEAYETELGMVYAELRHTMKHLKAWMQVESVHTPLLHFPARSRLYHEPLGVNLVLSPWNYPFQLSFAPLVASMAAGNCTIIKPSRHAPNTAEIMARLVKEYFDPAYISVVVGGQLCNDALLGQRWDHIFFTGSPSVGKLIMRTAAEHLTPVTLELGGKSPCIVDRTANIDLAARRIVWGKFLNAGQTCVAPDYVLVQQSKKEALIRAMGAYIEAFYGKEPLACKDLARIVNQRHFRRLESLLQHGSVCFGGGTDSKTQKIEPTILTDVSQDGVLMQQEIFGPILPVLTYETLDEAMNWIKEKEKPLSLYLFTRKKDVEHRVMNQLSFGGGCINDTIIHLANPHLPFGGVGQSGMGAYHGKRGFENFSHGKSVMKKSIWLDIPLRYPPYKDKLNLVKKIMR